MTHNTVVSFVRFCPACFRYTLNLSQKGVAAPEGLEKLQSAHPDVEIWVASIDEKLNEVGYILPGLGDAGDKIFGTK